MMRGSLGVRTKESMEKMRERTGEELERTEKKREGTQCIIYWVKERCPVIYILNAILFAYANEKNLEMHCISFID